MSQATDYELGAALSGIAFRIELNDILDAIVTGNVGNDAPGTTYPNMVWIEPDASKVWRRTNANDGWIDMGPMSSAFRAALGAIDGLTPASDRLPYFTGASSAALATFTSFARDLLDDADAATARTTLGVTAAYGKKAVWIPAGAMVPQVTNGPSRAVTEHATNDVMIDSLDYDQTTSELAQFAWRMPESWNESTVTFRSVWTAASGSGTFIAGLKAAALSDDDAIDGSWGTGVTVSDTLIATGDVHISAESNAVTVGGTPAAGDLVIFNVYRDISDTLNADARLIGIVLYVTTDAANDA